MTPKRNPPMTEAEWDAYVLADGRQFPHCLWLAQTMPAPKPRQHRRTNKEKGTK